MMAWLKVKTAVVTGAAVLVIAGCTATAIHKFERTPGGAHTMGAVRFVGDLQLKGRLPGFPVEEKRSGIVIPGLVYEDSAWQMSPTNTEIYPIQREVTVITNAAGGYVWHYAVSQSAKTNGWQLQRAWRTDESGKTVEEYPVR